MPRLAPSVSEKPPQAHSPPPASFAPSWTAPAAGETQSIRATNLPAPAAAAPVSAMSQPAPAGTLLARLDVLAEAWPEALRMEITQAGLGNSQVALPVHLVEPALKRGRVIFSWRYLRGWIQPTPPAVSVHDGVELELPLKVLAPLFFARQKNALVAQRKVSVAAEIPNLFFGFPQPAGAPAVSEPVPFSAAVLAPAQPVAAPSDTNFFTQPNQPQTSDTEFKAKGGTDFLTRAASPSQIVFKAMELPGVAGVIIALPDGLKVASQIPSDLNADTLAAFVPQIFARVNQCSRELRMGDLNNLSFTVGNVPWRIFRVNAVYFAAFGRAGEQLPAAPLAALAAELDRKKI
jgi:predicted regulator of Ras-like GTPase activity (Roadblock/LC7/MglB family)